MAKATGVKISELAKELNVSTKDILAYLRSIGLGDKAKTHNSSIQVGLAETVRQDMPRPESSDVSVAVEEAPPEEETPPKTKRSRKKKTTAKAEERPAEAVAAPSDEGAAPSEAPAEPQPAAPVAESPAEPATAALPADEAPPAAPEVPAIAAEAPPATEAPPAAPPAEAPAVAAEAPKAAPAKTGRLSGLRSPVTLATKLGEPPKPARQPVQAAPKLLVPEPAKIQGPRVVREEAPDFLPTPRRASPTGPRPGGVTTSTPRGGRGVRVAGEEEGDEKKGGPGKGRTLSTRRRGPDGRRGEAEEKLREFTDADLLERRERLANAAGYRQGFDTDLRKKSGRGTHALAKTGAARGEPIELEEPITVKSLSSELGIKANDIIVKLMRQGVFANINQVLDHQTAEAIALDYGIEVRIKPQASLEEELEAEFAARTADGKELASRPPVVTILGHVDHGKTSLLDRIRHANVAAGEAGGITQHTAAWMVEIERDGKKKRVTFIDTPGHQAFTAMRARGAAVTDVVVLVVSAAEGVQPQTVESINHARAAGVPIVVAMNKIDRPDVNPDMVLGQLAKENLNPVEWGGDTEVVRTSATTGQGIEDLIEILDYQAELLELKYDPSAPARGSIIESYVDPGLGPVATVLVQEGTLRVGDVMIAGPGYGRIRNLINDRRQHVSEAGAGTPVIVAGLDAMPSAGDNFYVTDDVERARSIAEERQTRARQEQLANRTKVSLENLKEAFEAGSVKEIRVIVKGDVQGSVETLAATVTQANTSEVKIRVIHAAVGPISESDVELADASDAVIVGFHVVPDDAAKSMAEQRRVEIRLYKVIYELLDDLKKALSGMLEPEIREKYHGRAEIRQTFKVPRIGVVGGCMVTDGHIQRGSRIRLIRNGVVVTEDLSLDSLRRVKDDVKEVRQGFECGLKIAGYDDIKVGDVVEAYVRETIQRTL